MSDVGCVRESTRAPITGEIQAQTTNANAKKRAESSDNSCIEYLPVSFGHQAFATTSPFEIIHFFEDHAVAKVIIFLFQDKSRESLFAFNCRFVFRRANGYAFVLLAAEGGSLKGIELFLFRRAQSS